jgi:parallel beta-helix repeat protein
MIKRMNRIWIVLFIIAAIGMLASGLNVNTFGSDGKNGTGLNTSYGNNTTVAGERTFLNFTFNAGDDTCANITSLNISFPDDFNLTPLSDDSANIILTGFNSNIGAKNCTITGNKVLKITNSTAGGCIWTTTSGSYFSVDLTNTSNFTIPTSSGIYPIILNVTNATDDVAETTVYLTVNPGDPRSINNVSGMNQTGAVNAILSNPFVFQVSDPCNNPVPNVDVNFTVTGGNDASSTASTGTTNASGQVNVILTLGNTPGTYCIKCEVNATPTINNAICATTTSTNLPLTFDIYVNKSGWWRDGTSSVNSSTTPIQAAIDNASNGNTIYVYNGTYYENVDVDKELTLQSEGADVVSVIATNQDKHVFNVTEDYVNISGFNVTNATGLDSAGIFLLNASHCNISNNNASDNYLGIWLDNSSNNTLMSNTADLNSDTGIWLDNSSNNTLMSNNASNSVIGIVLGYSSNNTLTSNTADLNSDTGIWLAYSSNNTLTSNTASNSDIGIVLGYSSNNTLYENIMYNNTYTNAHDDRTNNWNSSSSGNFYDLIYQTYMLNETTYSWINTTQTNASWSDTLDDNYSLKVEIGFDFILDNITYTHMQVVSNGVIQLIPEDGTELNDSSFASPTNWSTYYPNETFIFALCGDLNPVTGWYGYTKYITGNNDSENVQITQNLTVIDYHVSTCSDDSYSTNPNDFQVVLYENNTIRFNFKNLTYNLFDCELYSGIYLGNNLSTHAKETIHVARAGQYSNETSYSTPVIRTFSSTYDKNNDGIADNIYPIAGGTAVDNYPLVVVSKANSPSTASGKGTVSFSVNTDITDLASVGVNNISLYYKKESGAWTKYDDSTSGIFTFSTSSGGDYYFYTVATDNCGKIEGIPSTYDSKTTVSISSDTSGSSGSSSGSSKYSWTTSTQTPTSTESKDTTTGQPTPTKTVGEVSTEDVQATQTPTPTETEDGGIPGFTSIMFIAGLLAAAYIIIRKRG